MAFLWLVACGLVITFPLASALLFGFAAIIGFGFAASSDYSDLYVWASISVILALMSLLGWRGKRKERREAAAARLEQFNREQRLETLLAQQQDQIKNLQPPREPVTFPNFCPSCKHRNEQTAKFCAECGTTLAPA